MAAAIVVLQETTTTTTEIVVKVTDDPIVLWISVAIGALAIVIAGASGWFTYTQGKAIRRIETREHEWEQADRRSAHIQVNVRSEDDPIRFGSGTEIQRKAYWLRLRNTGRATAHHIAWEGSWSGVHADVDGLAELHAGESYDLYVWEPDRTDDTMTTLTVTWTDDRGRHSKTSPISF